MNLMMLSCKPLYNLSLSDALTLSIEEEPDSYKKGILYEESDEETM